MNWSRHLSTWAARAGVVVALLAVGGCGGTATVSGKVRYKGRTVTYGSVIFLNRDGSARSSAIEPDGSYKVTGVQRGTAKVAVISRDPSKGRSTSLGEPRHRDKQGIAEAKAATRDWFPLPHKFEDPANSGLTCTVDSSRVSYDIDL
jgi:hypothetical protein